MTRSASDPSALRRMTRLNNLLGSVASGVDTHEALTRARLGTAVKALDEARLDDAVRIAMEVINGDHDSSLAWRIVAVARERAGDFMNALRCYEQVVRIGKDVDGIEADLGRVAFHTGHHVEAEELFRSHLARFPDDLDAVNNLANALRDQMRYDDAIHLLRETLNRHPGCANLWNTLATILVAQGNPDLGLRFFDEAIRLDPDFAKAIYNRANLLILSGELELAIGDLRRALAMTREPTEQAMMRLALSQALLAAGHVSEGWEAYEARRDPHFANAPVYLIDRPLWRTGDPLAGRSVLVFGEQGLGDEVLFASVLPDLQRAIGPDGALTIAVEPRLVPLFQRSFPEANVGGHLTGMEGHSVIRGAPFLETLSRQIDCWMPMGGPLRQFRPDLAAFEGAGAFLKPDPERVDYWQQVLAALDDQPKVGVLWKSLKIDPSRSRHFTQFQRWAPVLLQPGITFVNLQYGDCEAELAEAEAAGARLWTPPGIDLKQDLDDVAALTMALDLIIGPANATSNIAAACGAPVVMVAAPGAWPQLGTDRWPFYRDVRVLTAKRLGEWDDALLALQHELQRRFAS